MSKIGLFTPSYNKPQYVLDAIGSVIRQTHTDWFYHIIENSTDNGRTRNVIKNYLAALPPEIRAKIDYVEHNFTDEERRRMYIPAYIANVYYDRINADFVFYMSDDDYIEPTCFQRFIEWFDKNPDKEAAYCKFGLKTLTNPGQDDHIFHIVGDLPACGMFGTIFQPGGHMPLNIVDGGQVLIRKRALQRMAQPFFTETPETAHACHSDGLFLYRIATDYKIYPIDCPDMLGYHRITRISTWRKA